MKIASVEGEVAVVDFEGSEDSEELSQDLAPIEVPIAKMLDDVFRNKTAALSFGSLSE